MVSAVAPPNPIIRHGIALLLLCALVVLLLHPYRPLPLGTDGSIFAAVGIHLNHDHVLYRDVWDHKPPLIFLLNALALDLRGETTKSIRELQTVFGVLSVGGLYLILSTLFRNTGTAFLSSVLFAFVFYSPILYGGGNFTEEYGVAFTLLGLLGLVRWTVAANRRSPALLVLSGFGFGCAVLAKEPFVLSALAWFFYVLLFSRSRFKDLSLLLVGSILPLAVPLGYFLANGALASWIEVIDYGFQYTKLHREEDWIQATVEGLLRLNELIFSLSALLTVLFLAGVISLRDRGFLKRLRHFPLFFLYWTVCNFAAAQLSGMFFIHYYLLMAAPIVCLAAYGLHHLVCRAASMSAWGRAAVASVFLFLMVIDFALPRRLGDRSAIPDAASPNPILEFLLDRKQPGDQLWASEGYLARYYLETGMLSPTPRLAVFSHHLRGGPDGAIDRSLVDEVHRDLRENPPRFILGVGHLRPGLRTPEGVEWFQTNYRFVPMETDGRDLELVFEWTADPAQSIIGQKKNWASEEAQYSEDIQWAFRNLLKLLQDSAQQFP